MRQSMFNIFPATITSDGRKVPVKDFNWQNDCTTDINTINSWTTQYPQLKFYGLPTGAKNNLLILDVDVKGGGLETIKNYKVPLTMSQTTISGGKHYIFKYPNDGRVYGNRVGFDDGLDIRGEGGYAIYYGTDQTPIAEAPEWLKDQALSVKKKVDLSSIVKICPSICQAILEEACDNIRNAGEGESNDVLNIEAYRIGQILHSIDHDEAFNELFKAAKDRGKPDYEATATIKSGLKGGSNNPLTSPFSNDKPPELSFTPLEPEAPKRWTPKFFSKYELTNLSNLRKPQLFRDWSTEDIAITTADGGTGKTTLKLNEAISLALGEDFLGFKCVTPGRTLFITGEDSREKIGAMVGAILKQMKILDDQEKVATVMNSILVKKEGDMCLVTKTKEGFYAPNMEALNSILEAIEDIKPKLIVFDPIAMFWGPESGLNDMTKAVAKFMAVLVEKSNACVEAINHMGKSSSTTKDMSQFAGRGGTGLPSHARVSRVLRPLANEEYQELTGLELPSDQSAILCNVNKFSDGSKLYNKPFVIVRDGYLFSRVTLTEKKAKEESNKMSDAERVFQYIKNERDAGRYPNKTVIIGHFGLASDKIPSKRVDTALGMLMYTGFMGVKLLPIDNPNVEVGGKCFTITDLEGKEL